MAANTERGLVIEKHTIELDGDTSKEELQETLDQIADQISIQKIQIEVEPTGDLLADDIAHSPEKTERTDTEPAKETPSAEAEENRSPLEDDETGTTESELDGLEWTELVSLASDHDVFERGKDREQLIKDIKELQQEGNDTHEGSEAEESGVQSTPHLHYDSNPHRILKKLNEIDGWIRTNELKELIPDELDVSEDTLSVNLHNLEDRDLVTKRDYEEDKRQNEYRISELGQTVLRQTEERSPNQATA